MSMARRIHLDTPAACQVELERVTNGLALLDHLYTQAREALDEAQVIWAEFEAAAAKEVRGTDEKLTATEIRGRITQWVAAHPEAAEARDSLAKIKADLDKISRWFKSAEQRSTNAAAAMKAHMGSGKYGGGFSAQANYGGR